AGKTVTTEFAYFEPGPTRNPHHLDHTPGGSSSGSAAAVAAGMATLALGTQTIGSVIRPAAFCGIVGYKPTYNRISPEGLIFFSRSADHVGLFTQDMAGMRLAASILVQGWNASNPSRPPAFGIPVGPYLEQASAEGLKAFRRQVESLRSAGYRVAEVPLFADIEEINRQHRRMIAAEFAYEHRDWFARYESLYRPRTAELIRQGQQVPADEVDDIRAAQAQLREQVEAIMAEREVDIWLAPAAPGPAPAGISSTGDPIMNLPWTYLGLPAVTIPAGRGDNGLPLGLQMVGRWGQDEHLLAWAEETANRVFGLA
ncbi:MAG: amidase, partial [Caldilineae bacterium]